MKIKKHDVLKITIALFILFILQISTTIVPAETGTIEGFDKGIPWQPFIPLKRVTFVEFDKESYIDDYAYLASIPGSVFSDGEKLFANPLLFFQPDGTYPDTEKYLYLNDYNGTHFLMEDWMGYCNGRLDKLTAINVDKDNLEDDWNSKDTVFINSNDPFDVASKIALNDWSYANNAVIAVIEENYEKPDNATTAGTVEGKLTGEIGEEKIKVKRPFGIASEYEYFTIEGQYKYVKVELWYPSFVINFGIVNKFPGFGKAEGITLPSVDPDLQIFCRYEDNWLETSTSSEMTISKGPLEKCFSYVYKSGDWRIGVTNMPTEGGDSDFINYGLFEKGRFITYGTFAEALKNLLFGVKEFNAYITKYPGVEIEIPDTPPFGCRDATFKLTWNNKNIKLGLTIIGPSGEEIDSVFDEDADSQEIKIQKLGECLDGEHLRAVVYALNDVSLPVDFTVEYSWQQNITKKQADMTASACEGAILGSTINAPLLYVKSDEAPKITVDTLYKLGVNQIYLVDLGGYLKQEVINDLSAVASINKHYKSYKDVYNAITEKTGSNDVVFSTIDPWSYWYYEEDISLLKPAGEYAGAFHFGPASYAAAYHGTPLLLVDNHPELSGAVTWHADFWIKHGNGYTTPPIACMFLTGTRVYDFLREYGFDKEGPESILTVADQYDIGPTWTRVFAGVANPGGIIGTPVDATNHITRCIFYPALIFENPAAQEEKVTLINGSKSERVNPLNIVARLLPSTPGLSNLKIIRESGYEEYIHPVLHTYGCYLYRFNEMGSKYWGVTYQTRTGHTPGKDISGQEIDEGVLLKSSGKAGSFLPDLDDSEVAPFYASKAGYSNAFSTNYDATIDNLNQGVISWYMVLHGDSGKGGQLSWWQPMSETLKQYGIPSNLADFLGKLLGMPLGANPEEENPWRGYDMLWGSTEEPDSATLDSEIGIILGWLGLANKDGPLNGGFIKPGLDILPSNIPFLKFLGNRENYHDGLIGPYGLTAMLIKFSYSHPAKEVDSQLKNLHSMDFHAGSCLIGTKYIQIALMRHGSVLQEADPWPTSYWGGYSFEMIPREYALGKTAGETYAEGITTIGIKYIFEKNEERTWWWDGAENVVLFTDPDLRIWTPSSEYSDKNNWESKDIKPQPYDEELSINGHMPFGVSNYPNEKHPMSLLEQYYLVIIALIIVIVVVLLISRKKNN
ncbi:MAG: hypothetical protein BV456_01300 [Thermoplasmata archaeon M8B2D]|nr:MAG: hypothetical protein BV456_01300 [Thermoplasmata archaeon M8B2D]